jgi:uracil-DNA glycosylase family 4
MRKETIERAEAWLRYSQELGLSPFYWNRLNGPGISASRPSDFATSAGPPLQQPPARKGDGQPVLPNASAAPVISPLPSPPAPSLFDIVERVEGDTLEAIHAFIGDCTRCKLHARRHSIVFGDGNPKADLVFIGEGPGADEDAQGLPFVGRAGKLLTQMIQAMGLERSQVYICNVVKCRPPENRQPEKDEIATCSPFLFRQLDVIRPKVIVCLGATALQALFGTDVSISRLRGKWIDYRGTQLLPTYHPAYLLRNPSAKADVWKDLQKVMEVLGLAPKRPPR